MDTYQQQKDNILRFFREVIELCKAQGNMALAQQLTQDAYRLKTGKLFVVVSGEFKQGKSSLLDAFIDEPALFPANPDIATCLVSTIQYAPQEKITVMVDEGGQVVPKTIQRNQIRDYVMEGRNANNMRQARMLTIETPNSQLQDGLVFVDTPGTGGLFKRHSEITYTFLPNADVVLFVSDAMSPLSKQDLAFVEKIVSQCQRIIFVVTKTDLSNERDLEHVIQGNRAKLSKLLNSPSDEIRIVPVSSTFKLNYLQSKDPDDLADSNFETLERELWDILAKRGDILLGRALLVLEQALNELQAPLETEMQALTNNPKIEDMKRQLQNTNERMRLLESSGSEWRIQLQQGLRSIRDKMNHQFQYDFLELRKQLNVYLDTPELLKEPTKLLSLVEQDIYQIMTKVDKDLQAKVTELRTQIEKTTGIGLTVSAITVTDYNKPAVVKLQEEVQPKKEDGWWSKLTATVSRGRGESMAGETIGAVLGGALGLGLDVFTFGLSGGSGALAGMGLGASLGGLIGRIAGYRTGITRGLEQMKTQELNEVKHRMSGQLSIFVEQSKLQCSRTIADAMDTIEATMIKDFVRLIEEERTICKGLLKTIDEAQKLSQQEARKRLLALTPTLQLVKHLRASLQQLAQPVVAAATATDDDGDFADA